jgi:hypothetical protein
MDGKWKKRRPTGIHKRFHNRGKGQAETVGVSEATSIDANPVKAQAPRVRS